MIFNEAGLQLLKEFEGCRLTAYRDLRGIPTIGYGHTSGVQIGQIISQQEADDLLLLEAKEISNLVRDDLSVSLNDNQFSALTCLAYNIGPRHLAESTVLKVINAGAHPLKEWLEWDEVNGDEVDGLLRRRKAELELYDTPVTC